MQVWFWVRNNPNPLNLDLPDIGTGETVNFSLGATVDNAPAFTQLKITGYDDDDFGGGLCTQGLPPFGSGSNDCMDWVTAEKVFNLTSSGPTEAFTTSEWMAVVDPGVDLEFQVFVTFVVSFV